MWNRISSIFYTSNPSVCTKKPQKGLQNSVLIDEASETESTSQTREHFKDPVADKGDSVSSVWLFTDGHANNGITNVEGIIDAQTEALSAASNTSVFTFGFGTSHNADMLRAIAEAGSGMYYFIEKPEAIPDAFADCLGGLLSVVAQNLRLTVTAGDGVRILQLLNQHGSSEVKDGLATVQLRDLYAEEERDIVLEVEIPAAEVGTEQGVVSIGLDYFDPVASTKHSLASVTVRVSRTGKTPDGQLPNAALDKQRNRLRMTEIMRHAKKDADAGNLKEAREMLQACNRAITTSATGADQYCLDLMEDVKNCEEQLCSVQQYQAMGTKMMVQTEGMHSAQRSSAMCSGVERYQTSAKSCMKKKAKGFF